jgi:hypothetical protein
VSTATKATLGKGNTMYHRIIGSVKQVAWTAKSH